MRFDKKHLVDIKSLTEKEASVFLEFLALERRRHLRTAETCGARVQLWDSELVRQIEEVEHIDRGIEEVNKKFGWEK